MSTKLATIELAIPYKRAGNVITQKEVRFEVYKEEDIYTLVPLIDEVELQIANLPKELKFKMENNRPVSLRGIKDGNLHVIEDAVKTLSKQFHLL